MTDFPITVFHNPNCGTSSNVVALIREAGFEPEVVEYLKTGWTLDQLKNLLVAMGEGPRHVLREMGTPAAELGLLEPHVSDDDILAAMVEHPILVNRPIVRTPLGVVLARPKERALTVLPRG